MGTTISPSGCKDKLDTCPAWKKEGECTKIESQNFMKKYCAKTCHLCSATTAAPATTTAPHTTAGCTDSKELAAKCPVWKKEGECTKTESQKFMKKYCPKTCDLCDTGCKDSKELAAKCPVWKLQGECTKIESQKFMKKYCPKTCDLCSKCKDVLPQSKCKELKIKSYCTTSAEFMKKNCQKTCDKCSVETTVATTITTGKPTATTAITATTSAPST